jgi:hypothetical protein
VQKTKEKAKATILVLVRHRFIETVLLPLVGPLSNCNYTVRPAWADFFIGLQVTRMGKRPSKEFRGYGPNDALDDLCASFLGADVRSNSRLDFLA